jgi:serine/threonine protein kinase
LFVYRRISGGRLFDYLCLQSIITEQTIARYIQQLFDGLNYLHHCKIVHLDIQVRIYFNKNKIVFCFFVKPENLLFNIEHDQIKLCDFGDSIRLSNMRYVHRMIGNIEFAAPEIIDGNIPVNYKTDVW